MRDMAVKRRQHSGIDLDRSSACARPPRACRWVAPGLLDEWGAPVLSDRLANAVAKTLAASMRHP